MTLQKSEEWIDEPQKKNALDGANTTAAIQPVIETITEYVQKSHTIHIRIKELMRNKIALITQWNGVQRMRLEVQERAETCEPKDSSVQFEEKLQAIELKIISLEKGLHKMISNQAQMMASLKQDEWQEPTKKQKLVGFLSIFHDHYLAQH
ncbi:hypothetical protein B9Z55_011027 [Caenorhabditis nigoni]|uniref:Uncharacterized protein n=1 Tax=Caenorhabditis nigoni TaxID=1611254 RepID=A0A2G5UIA6_9PELO|nr:hypothetical protein B9Z55_011027 [Caenorhabditis nigoni]